MDPFTGEPLGPPLTADQLPRDLDDEESLVTSRGDQRDGFVDTPEAGRAQKLGMAVAIPLILVALATPVMVGAFAMLLGVRGSLEADASVLVPALIIGGSLAAAGGVAGAMWLWPAWVPQGPLRTLTFGVLTSAIILGVIVLFLGLAFSR